MREFLINIIQKNPDLFFSVLFYLGLICFYFVIRFISRLTDYNEPSKQEPTSNHFDSDKYDYNS